MPAQARSGALLLGALVFGLVGLAAAPARAQQVRLFGELRGAGLGMVGSPVQFGRTPRAGDDPSLAATGPCRDNLSGDGGAYVAGTGLLSVTSASYSYSLGLSAGYRGIACTDAMRWPLGGLDFRGRHRLGERTQVRSGLRANFDVFDRTLDFRFGTFNPNEQVPPAAGTLYFTGNAYVEVERWLSRRHALRTTASVQTMQVATDLKKLPDYTTLGPMAAAEAQLEGLRQEGRDLFELMLRYRVSHYYPVSLALEREQTQVPPAHDGSLRFLYERRVSPLLTLHGDLGAALARQDHLCLPGPALADKDLCSIDRLAPGVRGAAGRPAAELLLGRRTTGTFVGELSLRYQSQRHVVEAALSRGYEPNPYAAALDLVNRVSATAQLRPVPEVLVTGSALLGHHGHTSPGRLNIILPDEAAARVSPQNRTMLMGQGSLGVDWAVRRGLAVFGQANAQVFAIRGEEVQERDAAGRPILDMDGGQRQVPRFPQGDDSFQTVWRLSLLLGVRVFTEVPQREPNLLQNARVIP